jgi:hypothetical protein
LVVGARIREPAFWRSRARGRVERSEVSRSMSDSEPMEESDVAEDLLRRLVGRSVGMAHSGVGFRVSNCRRRRLVYSLPLTTSSASFVRSFRNRGLFARETISLSSSLSSHAGASPLSDSSSSEDGRGISAPVLASGASS